MAMTLYATIRIDLDDDYTDIESAKDVVTQAFYDSTHDQADSGIEFSLCDYVEEI